MVGTVLREDAPRGVIFEGALLCSTTACRREYPIVDGVPYLIAGLTEFIGQNAQTILARDDLSPWMESLIGDCCGPASTFVTNRHHLSTYAFDHYGAHDPDGLPEPFRTDGSGASSVARPGSMARLLERGLDAAGVGGRLDGPIIDLGCSVGGGTFALAEKTSALALGIDLHVGMLRVAARVLAEGVVSYPRRRVGVVYDRRTYPVPVERERVDFWCANASALPLAPGVAGLVTSLNLLDCTADPKGHLQSIASVLAPAGVAILATPFDWASGATSPPGWIGGHSQRGPARGQPEPTLRSLLAPDGPVPLAVTAERASVPWGLRLHDRQTVHYRAYVAALRRDK